MELTEDIKHILDEDETVLLSTKPNKVRYAVIGNIVSTLTLFIFGGIFILLAVLMIIGVFKDENGVSPGLDAFIPMIIAGSLPIIIALVNLIGRFVRYKNTVYMITNKRLIIRSGFIGVDYKSLNNESISTIDVRVDALDKLVHPNTGTIYFGSAASPIVNAQNQAQAMYKFENINDPYETYKKIKEFVSNNR